MAQTEVKATNLTDEDRKFIAKYRDGLTDTTLRAKWIHSPDERPDHDGQTLATRSHEVIRAWAEARGARPATVPGTEHDGLPGVLRFDFGEPTEGLQEIDWDTFFEAFDRRNLVFVFQETTQDGKQSKFFIFDSPDRQDG